RVSMAAAIARDRGGGKVAGCHAPPFHPDSQRLAVVAAYQHVATLEQIDGRAYRQSIAQRIPLAIAVFLGSVALSPTFELLRLPERRQWMLGFAAAFLLLSTVAWGAARRREEWIVPILVAFVAVIGVAINAYHAIVHASVAMCIWVLTALLCSSAL